jgi:transcriptional regulator with XRE-family HTH domain
MAEADDIEQLARERLRTLRRSRWWSLDELAARTHLSASTISRIETGKRAMSLDVLVALARALQVDVNSLVDTGQNDEDILIRPIPSRRRGTTIWPLSRPTGATTAIKMRLQPTRRTPELQVHPGHDWLFVLQARSS